MLKILSINFSRNRGDLNTTTPIIPENILKIIIISLKILHLETLKATPNFCENNFYIN